MDGRSNQALTLALVFGIAAGSTAAVSFLGFPYIFRASFAALQAGQKRVKREQQQRLKLEKTKRVTGKTNEYQIYKEILIKSLIKWEDIDISFDNFPYFLREDIKKVMIDATYVFLKRPEYAKKMSNLISVSSKILLNGPPGSEIYQEMIVKALAQKLQVSILVFDYADVLLEAKEMQPSSMQNFKDDMLSETSFSPNDECRDQISKCNMLHSTCPYSLPPLPKIEMKSQDIGLKTLLQCFSGDNGSMSNNSKINPQKSVNIPSLIDENTSNASKCLFNRGDRVRFIGQSIGSSTVTSSHHHRSSVIEGPSVGAKGQVVLLPEDNPNMVGVKFDKPVFGGNKKVDLCEDGHGYFCNVTELSMEHSVEKSENVIVFNALVDVLRSRASTEPLILLIKDVERGVLGNAELYRKLEKISNMDLRIVMLGLRTRSFQKDKGHLFSSSTPKSSHGISRVFDIAAKENRISRLDILKGDDSKSSRSLSQLFPTRIYLHPPQEKNIGLEWEAQMEKDSKLLVAEANRRQLRMVMVACGFFCDNLHMLDITNLVLTNEMAEKVVGWAASQQLQNESQVKLRGGKLILMAESIKNSVQMLTSVQRASPSKCSLKEVLLENEFERLLLSEVIPPDELGVTFGSIGALEMVKETLQELVMLPLQRPELFVKGQLIKPCKGLLLFGPPGTGKTMLAKAVATESGANFINISMATVTSKWFGETVKFVRALFSLAYKIAPTVIFIDEVDSMLGRRGNAHEHQSMRKLNNEFMASWDGLRTRDERVLVLAATNRPFDLDDAVIRRFPRRIMVDLPDAKNRAKILKVILHGEVLCPEIDIEELAAITDGYSGSDLKNLCISAAHEPIRELLKEEKKEIHNPEVGGEKLRPSTGQVSLRPISMADIRQAMEKVRSSVSLDAKSIHDLQLWNEQYGEGGVRTTENLTYFI